MGDAGPLGPLFKPTLGPLLRCVYRAGLARKNARFDADRGVTRLSCPVISVGNLSVGGTGKTPMVETIVRLLRRNGHHPCIAMRGYKSKAGLSDEAESYRAAFEEIQIVAQPDRTVGLQTLLAKPEGNSIDTIILDDGFQHRQIARDLDLVLIDATRNPFGDQLLPMGYLRELPAALARADAVIVTRADQVSADELEQLKSQIALAHKRPPIAVTNHEWNAIHSSRTEEPLSVASLKGQRVLLVCAIGNPQAMLRQTEGLGIGVVEALFLPDHDPYAPSTIDRIRARATALDTDAILVTEKDWSKLRSVPPESWPVAVLRPELGIAFMSGEQDFEEVVLAVRSLKSDSRPR